MRLGSQLILARAGSARLGVKDSDLRTRYSRWTHTQLIGWLLCCCMQDQPLCSQHPVLVDGAADLVYPMRLDLHALGTGGVA
jgi:hypothetical protein